MNANPNNEAAPHTALLAEDDECIREIVASYLERLGYLVLEAENGQQAISLIEQRSDAPFDLIVTDILMPRAGGEAVAAAALERGACGRFLFISGFASHMVRLAASIREGAAYLEKPFTFQAFEEKVESLYAARLNSQADRQEPPP